MPDAAIAAMPICHSRCPCRLSSAVHRDVCEPGEAVAVIEEETGPDEWGDPGRRVGSTSQARAVSAGQATTMGRDDAVRTSASTLRRLA